MKLLEMVKGVFIDVKTHWSKPAKGKCISYKEMVAYSVGGMGVNFIAPLITYITLSAGSLLVGSTFGIKPMTLQILNMISMVIQGFIITPIRGMIIDNTRSKAGKFRPYILTMGIPTAILCCLLVFLPIDRMSDIAKAVAVFIVYNCIQTTYLFYQGSYANLVQVMSPNTEERATTISISSVIYSLAPTITGFLIPILADIYKKEGGMSYIGTYRIVMPVFSILGVLLGLFAFFGTRERLVVAKKYVPKVGFAEGISKMAKNKYFWIIMVTQWTNVIKIAVGTILPWLFVYDVQNNTLFGIMTTVMGTSALVPMLIAPVIIKKVGKKNMQVWTNFLAALSAGLMIPAVLLFDGTVSAVFLFLLLYVFNFANAFLIIVGPAQHAEMRDYQQYRSGDRLEGIEGTLGGLAGTFVTAFLGLVIPAMFEHYGLLDNYDVLFNKQIRDDIFIGLGVISLVGSIMTGAPFLFYDLSERKHYNIIKVLKVRALFADYRNGDLTDAKLVDTIDAINEAINLSQQEKRVIDRSIIATAKAMPNGTPEEKTARRKAIRDAKKKIQEDIRFNNSVDAAIMVYDELNKFNTEAYQVMVAKAEKLVASGPQGLTFIDEFNTELTIAREMPTTNSEEFIAKKKAVSTAKKSIRRAKLIMKRYPNGIVEPDYQAVHDAFDMPEDTREQRRARKVAIKKAEAEIMRFRKVALPFIDAQKLIAEKESYAMFDELLAMYPAAKERCLVEEARQEEERKRLEAERKAELEEARQARMAKRKAKGETAVPSTTVEEAVFTEDTPVESAESDVTTEDTAVESVDTDVTEEPVVESADTDVTEEPVVESVEADVTTEETEEVEK